MMKGSMLNHDHMYHERKEFDTCEAKYFPPSRYDVDIFPLHGDRVPNFHFQTGIMRYVAAYVLAVLGGKDEPTADYIRAIIESVGVEVDETNLGLVLEKLKGKNIQEIQEAGE